MSGVVASGRLNGEVTKRSKLGADTGDERLPPKAVKLLSGHEGEVSNACSCKGLCLMLFEGIHVSLEPKTTPITSIWVCYI